jgi:hypothetical protein
MFWLGDFNEIKKGQAGIKKTIFYKDLPGIIHKAHRFMVATQKEGIHQRLLRYQKIALKVRKALHDIA